jgi:hypothetical protein
MSRIAAGTSLDEAVRQALEPIVAKASAAIARAIADSVAARLEQELTRTAPRSARALARVLPKRAGRSARTEITRWVADRRARRVPNFVIDATGLKIKKQIVARYGEAAFEKGKPLPKAVENAGAASREDAKTAPRAKGPVVRKKAAA